MRWAVGFFLFVALFAGGVALLHAGVYGLTVFLWGPMALGGIVTWMIQPVSARAAAGYSALATLVVVALLFATGIEGMGCIVVSLPLLLPLAALGGILTRRSLSSRAASRGSAAMFLVFTPAAYTFDTHAQPPVYAVHSAITIAAPPDRVWREIIQLSTLPAPDEWYFHTGLAYPTAARIEGSGPGAVRYCEFSTGPVVETIDTWDAPRLLQFHVTETPAPLREWTPYREVQPRHLKGYLLSRAGEFRLTALAGNRTLLEGTSWYQHGLYPAEYWRWWSDAVMHRIHLRVFHRIRQLAETRP